MRRIFWNTEQQIVNQFVAKLILNDVDYRVEKIDGEWTVWVLNEDHLGIARELLESFQYDPNEKIILNLPEESIQEREKPKPNLGVRRRIYVERSNHWTIAIIGICLIVTYCIHTPGLSWVYDYLSFSNFEGRSFPEIRNGEIWRLVTPIFMHGGVLHVLFNMLWLYDLGSQVEREEGVFYYILVTLFWATLANTAQYLVSGANFIGYSGVTYALTGYVWMMVSFSRKYNYFLAQGTITIAVIWMVLCIVGVIPNVANTEHVVGFFCGVALGYVRSGELKLWLRQKFRKRP